LTLFFPNNLQTANLNVKLNCTIVNKSFVPACLSISVVIAQKHFTASHIRFLQKLGLVGTWNGGLVGCHYVFLIF